MSSVMGQYNIEPAESNFHAAAQRRNVRRKEEFSVSAAPLRRRVRNSFDARSRPERQTTGDHLGNLNY